MIGGYITGQLADTPTRGLVISRTGQVADGTARGLVKLRTSQLMEHAGNRKKQDSIGARQLFTYLLIYINLLLCITR